MALVLAFIMTRPLGAPEAAPAFVPGTGEEQLKRDAAEAGLATGRSGPGLATDDQLGLVSLDARVSLGAYRGRAVWVVFWATYCEACKEEEPDLIAMSEAHAGDGLVVLGVNVGEPVDEVRDYVRSHNLRYPIVIDTDGRAQAAYGTIGTPTHYFVDANGTIRDRAFGRLTRAEMELRVESIHRSSHQVGADGP
jgi:cytochrome c biogenesis protein CcmG/thiol:disulfide interchange protein DsbE